jgi:opacity protein-like surface antigen
VLSTAAGAADLPPPIAPPPIYKAPAADFGGWYLRGDIGFSHQRIKNVEFVPGPTLPPLTSQETLSVGADVGSIFGLGIGYQFNWFRFDVTGEYRGNAGFHSINRIVGAPGNVFPESNRGSKSEWVVLANVYADLGTWWCITPFIGAGIGGAYNTITNFTDIAVIQNGNNFAEKASKWNMAWALHAGLAYKVTPNFTIELAYRYLNLGDAETGRLTGYDGTFQGEKERINGLTSHDVKLGVRWLLNPAPELAPPPPPLMRKG